ncbi:malate synthase G [Gracilibacillus salitolerans]|uniref:Malate synthase G n=1 Tax=Gracilibacillus salitolerans TaxID=2663022 RepID=A0A5Q2TTQ7_9BACI|nr:malate synthase G [Gracilibacillus salitolerans]QGH36168.1 malate synthase G [Gracilibacillus salitolerans]
MIGYVLISNLYVDEKLFEFINSRVLPGSGLTRDKFWEEFSELIHDFIPRNNKLLKERDTLHQRINKWYKENEGALNMDAYQSFLKEINYIEAEVTDFTVNTQGIDKEIAIQSGPQLVVPVDNARYALNAANARWGSLYDALYGTDVISEDEGAERSNRYNPQRGKRVVSYAKQFLDDIFPIKAHSHTEVVNYSIMDSNLVMELGNGESTMLSDKAKFIGYRGGRLDPEAILLKNNHIHVEIQIDKQDKIGSEDNAGIKDILIESALTTILDCEDSVAAVDANDKILVYSNLLGLMKGDLSTSFVKGSQKVTRTLQSDRQYVSPTGNEFTLQGRSLMFIRNVGHLMTTNAILDENQQEIPEGIMDGVLTSLIAKHDILRNSNYQNSREASIYIVKPKMHGSKEVAFANELFNRIEEMIDLDKNTLKIGVMDEERRTTLNLKNCIYQVRERIAFINTGFLDRTGDEIHTSMELGPMIRKNEMKTSNWLQSYEKSNVNVGLATGLQGHAQIGKGMWAMPDLMKDMLDQKGNQLKAGANTAWVPSPIAATLHALHYHQINVHQVQRELGQQYDDVRNEILDVPVTKTINWTPEEIQQELDNNAQGILGYVVRWIDMGIGCSKVPDINNISLMEDRATLRISSQHIANWLYHDICTKEQVMETMKRMARVVDKQNSGDPEYKPMSNNLDVSIAFQAACDLVFKGVDQPNGYTEPILHSRRLEAKAKIKH